MKLIKLGDRTYQPDENGNCVQYRTKVKRPSGTIMSTPSFNEKEREEYCKIMNAREGYEVVGTYNEVIEGVTPEDYHEERMLKHSQ